MVPPEARQTEDTGRMLKAAASALCLSLLAGLTASCQSFTDPETGQTTMRWTLPGTEANQAAAVQRWNQCIEFRSESFCERNLPGGRPVVNPPDIGTLPYRQNDP